MKQETTPIEVTAKDILELGFTYYNNDGLMTFGVDYCGYMGFSFIMLRSVLKCFGDYQIIGESDYTEYSDLEEQNVIRKAYHTNLPQELFFKVTNRKVKKVWDLE